VAELGDEVAAQVLALGHRLRALPRDVLAVAVAEADLSAGTQDGVAPRVAAEARVDPPAVAVEPALDSRNAGVALGARVARRNATVNASAAISSASACDVRRRA
jgi:hypothetical protein